MSRGQMVLVLLVLWRTGGAKHTNTPNVGTSIFKEEDYIKSCWTLQDAALLNARRIMQDLIPRNSLDTRKDDFVPRLMSYFHSAAELIRARTRGPVQHSLLLALSDVIGGYLHVYVLPLARRGYYCGVVRYKNTRELHDLYEQILRFLKTDGSNWMRPSTGVGSSLPVHPIGVQPLKPSESEHACQQIITYRASDVYSRAARRPKMLVVPIPYLDDPLHPRALAVPLRHSHLLSLLSEQSVHVLSHYYLAAVRCLAGQPNSAGQLAGFHDNLNNWLHKFVLPRLEDDLWYPGFGGVLQILETLKRSGVEIRGHWGAEPLEDPILPPPEPQPWSPVEEEESGLRFGKVELPKTHNMFLPGDHDGFTMQSYLILGLMVIIAVFVCMVCLSVLGCLFRRKDRLGQRREKGPGDSDEALEESSGHFFNRFYNSLRRIRKNSGKNCGCDPAMHEECGCRSSVPTVRRIPPEITQGIRVAVDKLERVEDTGRRIETGPSESRSSPDKMVDVAFITHKKKSSEDMTSDEDWSNTGSSSEESVEPRSNPP